MRKKGRPSGLQEDMSYHLPISRQRQHELLVSLIEYALADLGGSLRMQTVCHSGIKEQKSKHTISIPPCHAFYSKQTFPVSSLQITLKVHPSNPLQPVHHNTLTQIPRTRLPIPRCFPPATSPSQNTLPNPQSHHQNREDGIRRQQNQRVRPPPQHPLQALRSRP